MTTEINPFQAPDTPQILVDHYAESPPLNLMTRSRVAVWLLVYLHPFWLLASFYLTWLLAWAQLGYPPRPMLDDPKSIGGIMDIAYYLPCLLMMLGPVLVPFGLVLPFILPINKRLDLYLAWKVAFFMSYVGLCAIALLVIRYDPGRVVEWWFD